MSISLDMRQHPRVQKALDEASALIWSWVEHQPENCHPEGMTAAGLRAYLSWWPGHVAALDAPPGLVCLEEARP